MAQMYSCVLSEAKLLDYWEESAAKLWGATQTHFTNQFDKERLKPERENLQKEFESSAMFRESPHPHTLEATQLGETATAADDSYTAAIQYAAELEKKYDAQAGCIIKIEASVDGQTILIKATYFASIAVSTGANKELKEIRETTNQLATSVTAQAETLAALSISTNSGGGGWNSNKKKARPGLHMCVHCKREVYHKDANCLEMDTYESKCYPGWKRFFAKE